MLRVKPRRTAAFTPEPRWYSVVTSASRQFRDELLSAFATAVAASARAVCDDAIEQLSSTTNRKSTLALPGAKVSHCTAFGSPNCATAEPPAVSPIEKMASSTKLVFGVK